MCNCMNMCRDFAELAELPKWIRPSGHHPRCEDYKLINFKRVELDGASFIDTPENVQTYLDEDDNPDAYTVTDIRLTKDQFESLSEFEWF